MEEEEGKEDGDWKEIQKRMRISKTEVMLIKEIKRMK